MSIDRLFALTTENQEKIGKMREIEKQEKELDKQRTAIRKTLTALTLEVGG